MSLCWVAGVVWINTVHDMKIPLILYAGPLPCWLMFFVMGVQIGHKPQRQYSLLLPIVITIIGFVLSVVESDYLLCHYGNGVGIKPSSYIYSAGMVSLMFSNRIENWIRQTGLVYRFLIWIGKLSFGIYLIHCYFINYFISRLPVDSWLLKWVITLSLTVAFIMTLRKILPLKCHKYLGI